MHLRSISLRDWKAFEVARFDLPAPNNNRNVILVGGRNGFGKTTLFEAVVLGLFGRDGLPLVARAKAAADVDSRARSFSEFMERALHGSALRMGRNSCHIALTFENDRDEPVVVERTWYFTDAGKLRPVDGGEQIRIMFGSNRRVIGPTQSEPDPHNWYRDWISRTFLPTHLANFFLFDGEAASVYAERDMSVQVRDGIEGLLGLDWVRRLAKDLRDYAANRRADMPRGVDSVAISRLEQEIRDTEEALTAIRDRLDVIAADLAAAETERDALTRELAGYGTGSRAQLEELIADRERYDRAYTEAQDRLQHIAAFDLPLAMTGPSLRVAVAEQLHRESVRETWLASCEQGQSRVDRVLGAVRSKFAAVCPALLPPQEEAVTDAVRNALDQLWYPPPSDASDNFRHPHARGEMNARVRDRLGQAAKVSFGTVKTLLDAMASAARARRDLDNSINSSQATAPQIDEKKKRLQDLNTRISSLSQEKGEKNNIVSSRAPELEQKRKELRRLTALLDQSAPAARRAFRAEEVAAMLDDLIAEAWPMQSAAVAEAMTKAIRSMAHRNDYLHTVRIDDDGAVKLLNIAGRNLRDFDLSAGEKQIFTQSLFAAIASVSGRIFPLVIDTPLGRLDEDHRKNVLRHLASRNGQVILISTDTEVVGPYLAEIRSRVIKAYRIENRLDGDVAVSWPVEGYFVGQEL